MKTVCILVGIYRLQHHTHVDVRRQRQLDEEARTLPILVETSDLGKHLFLSRVDGQLDLDGLHPDLRAIPMFSRDVGTRSGIVADEDRSETRTLTHAGEPIDPPCQLAFDLLRGKTPVDHSR